jgi:hypothetical protein
MVMCVTGHISEISFKLSDNVKLRNIQRFRYVISPLQGEGKSLINNVPVINENFTAAWQLVNDMTMAS